MSKSNLFLKFQVLREGSSFIAFFVEHSVCGNFKVHGVLILVFLFSLVTVNPKGICKSQFLLKFLGLREGSSVIASFVKHPI